jgi:hypothetical protein
MSKYADEMHLCGQLNKLCNKQIILNILEENTRLEGKVIHESRFDNIADAILKELGLVQELGDENLNSHSELQELGQHELNILGGVKVSREITWLYRTDNNKK